MTRTLSEKLIGLCTSTQNNLERKVATSREIMACMVNSYNPPFTFTAPLFSNNRASLPASSASCSFISYSLLRTMVRSLLRFPLIFPLAANYVSSNSALYRSSSGTNSIPTISRWYSVQVTKVPLTGVNVNLFNLSG